MLFIGSEVATKKKIKIKFKNSEILARYTNWKSYKKRIR